MKNPYLIEIFSPKKEVQHLENFFQKSENISFLAEELQDDIQNCLVESKEDNDNIGIIYALDESIEFIKKILDKHEIVYKLKQIRKSIHYGEYPFEVSEDFKKSLEGVFFLTLTMDEILEKINKVGMSGLTVKELNLLQTYSKEI